MLHVPPEVVSVNVSEVPTHRLELPVIIPATGLEVISIICLAVVGPQELVNVYFIVSMPGA